MAWVNMNTFTVPRGPQQQPSRGYVPRHPKQHGTENGFAHSPNVGHSHHSDAPQATAMSAPATALSMFVNDLFAVASVPIDPFKASAPTLVELRRGDPREAWGFRLQGGSEYKTQLAIKMVKPNTPAARSLNNGDLIVSINGTDARNLTHDSATEIIKSSGNSLSLQVIKAIASINPPGLLRAAAAK